MNRPNSDLKTMEAGRYLIQLIRCVLNEEPVPICQESMDTNILVKTAKYHQCFGVLYAGRKGWLLSNRFSEDEEKQLGKEFNNVIFKDTIQANELQSITEQLEKAQIRYLPLKGVWMKKLYPLSTMREMSDIDILVDKERIRECQPMMKQLGYTPEAIGMCDHDVYQKKPVMDVELHWTLFEENENEVTFKYYDTMLERVSLSQDKKYGYEMSLEDFYIYMLAHMNKHHSLGGSGIRSMMDVWVYLREYHSQMDFAYIKQELEQLSLTGFEMHVRAIVEAWFDFCVEGLTSVSLSQEEIEKETNSLIMGGAYGNIESNEIGRMMKEFDNGSFFIAKCRRIVKLIFPGEASLVYYFPRVAHIKALRPALWIGRIVVGLVKKPDVVRGRVKTIHSLKKEEVESKRKMYEED